MLGTLLWWVILGGVVGWIVSLILGRDFKGGCLGYIAVGIVTMVLLGFVFQLLKALWLLIVVALLIIAIAWLVESLSRR